MSNKSSTTHIWIIDDDQSIRWILEKTLLAEAYHVTPFENGQLALDALDANPPDIILSDIRMPGINGLAMMQNIKQTHPHIPIIIITAHSDLDAAVDSFKFGAFDYLPKPFDIDDAVNIVNRAASHIKATAVPNQQLNTISTPANYKIIGESPAMQEVFRIIGRLAHTHINVLINGESGTGKELIAHALHEHSPRKNQPFIALNMAAIPKDLIESELFGHDKGAFTGAVNARQGRFEQAHQGTLFLDEIGDMPLDTQTRLLRVLAEGEFYRVGGQTSIKVNVRVIAATHQNLMQLVLQGHFREDLYHRLNVIKIQLPALKNRTQDIAALTHYFLEKAAHELNMASKQLHPSTLAVLESLPWPGNIRQLENTCRWLILMATSHDIYPQDLPPDLYVHNNSGEHLTDHLIAPSIQPSNTVSPDKLLNTKAPVSIERDLPPTSLQQTWEQALAEWATWALAQGMHEILTTATPAFEKILIQTALYYTQGQRIKAAELLGLGRNTLTRKIGQLQIDSIDDADMSKS